MQAKLSLHCKAAYNCPLSALLDASKTAINIWRLSVVQVLDFLLVMDIVLQFFRAYVNKKSVLVVKMSRVRRNYLGMHVHGTMHQHVCQAAASLGCCDALQHDAGLHFVNQQTLLLLQ